MDPIRLHFFLSMAVEASNLPLDLGRLLFYNALRQITERWPLVGCVVHYTHEVPAVIAVGRN